MAIELKIPESGESITEVQIGEWRKAEGDRVEQDEIVVEIETDKASMELPAPVAGVISKILKQTGETVSVGEVIGRIEEGDGQATPGASDEKKPETKPTAEPREERKDEEAEAVNAKAAKKEERTEPAREVKDRAAARMPDEAVEAEPKAEPRKPAKPRPVAKTEPRVMPAARRALDEHGLEPSEVEGTGPGDRVLKEDVLRYVDEATEREQAETAPAPRATRGDRQEEIVPMTMLRRRIAERLVDAQHTAAMLTTFNEVDMSAVKALRAENGELFEQTYGVRLGIMSFFVKAVIEALKRVPQVNAEIRGTDIAYRNYYDIGVAVATDRGLVVPVIRDADRLSFAAIEKAIGRLADRARAKKLSLEELQGGTFTITNGGVFGSLLSTPILNPPQSGILGLHAIQDRPVVREGEIVVRPMMYVALSYDHRLVDGREAVTFLGHVKALIENPARMLIEV